MLLIEARINAVTVLPSCGHTALCCTVDRRAAGPQPTRPLKWLDPPVGLLGDRICDRTYALLGASAAAVSLS